MTDPDDEGEEPVESEEGQLLAVYVGREEFASVSPQNRAFQTISAEIASKTVVPKRPLNEVVPKHYLKHRKVFEKTTFDELPPRCPWDHAIELIPGSQPLDCKIYPLA